MSRSFPQVSASVVSGLLVHSMGSAHSVRVQFTHLHADVDIQFPVSFTEETSLSSAGVY